MEIDWAELLSQSILRSALKDIECQNESKLSIMTTETKRTVRNGELYAAEAANGFAKVLSSTIIQNAFKDLQISPPRFDGQELEKRKPEHNQVNGVCESKSGWVDFLSQEIIESGVIDAANKIDENVKGFRASGSDQVKEVGKSKSEWANLLLQQIVESALTEVRKELDENATSLLAQDQVEEVGKSKSVWADLLSRQIIKSALIEATNKTDDDVKSSGVLDEEKQPCLTGVEKGLEKLSSKPFVENKARIKIPGWDVDIRQELNEIKQSDSITKGLDHKEEEKLKSVWADLLSQQIIKSALTDATKENFENLTSPGTLDGSYERSVAKDDCDWAEALSKSIVEDALMEFESKTRIKIPGWEAGLRQELYKVQQNDNVTRVNGSVSGWAEEMSSSIVQDAIVEAVKENKRCEEEKVAPESISKKESNSSGISLSFRWFSKQLTMKITPKSKDQWKRGSAP